MAASVSSMSLAEVKPPVAVKGTKEGLLFILDEQCEFDLIISFLQDLLHGESATLFEGPEIGVSIDFGSRKMSQEQIRTLMLVFLDKGNFLIQEWGPRTAARRALFANHRAPDQTLYKGTVRAGQRLQFEGDVVVIGDVNPGGEIAATGDIYVFGRLRGIAHAGSEGKRDAVIAAADFSPMQLRIADVISRAPEADGRPLHTFMEFAYLREDGMAVDKTQYLVNLRHHPQV